jgi:DNA (cytosine-5)-methyltransferase 1
LGGKHQADRDDRDMFPAAVRAILFQRGSANEKLKPKAFVFENVKGLLRQTFADYFEYILRRLTYPSFTAATKISKFKEKYGMFEPALMPWHSLRQ